MNVLFYLYQFHQVYDLVVRRKNNLRVGTWLTNSEQLGLGATPHWSILPAQMGNN
ncbi:hypothetical protein [Colwellia sp. 12G3]|uniref:hypothetical protein n=1 Tax=Colwellia sp. 12G3 TaxID=2058299 RepID=UPI0012FF002A|nr:hypothetical protein [Colwellia sp. 12G3]